MRHLARLLLAIGALAGTIALGVPAASAQIALESSTPAAGEQLTVTPTEVRLDFDQSIDAERVKASLDNGAQLVELGDPVLDPNGNGVVVFPIVGAVPNGPLVVGWQAVGADGKVIEGRIDFVVSAPVVVQPGQTTLTGAPNLIPVGPTETPTTDNDTPGPTTPQAPTPAEITAAKAGKTPAFLLGVTRWVSYLAFSVWIGGLLLISGLWQSAGRSQSLRQLMRISWLALVVSSLLALIFQSWILRGSVGLSIGELWDVTSGRGLVAKFLLACGLGAFALNPVALSNPSGQFSAGFVSVVAALAIATSGHTATWRWLWIGVLVQMLHILAIAAWLGLLAVLGMVVMREANDNDARLAVAQFTSITTGLLAIIVATGVLQTVRFAGGPGNLTSTTYGRWLLVKVAIVGVMLLVARISRRRIIGRMIGRSEIARGTRDQLRRALITEFSIGAATLVVTALLVVQTPVA
jgi:copper transport protein